MKDQFLTRIWRKLTGGWAPYVEDAVPGSDLTLQMHQASVPSFAFFFMLDLPLLLPHSVSLRTAPHRLLAP